MEKMLLGNESIDLRLCLMDSAQCFHFDAHENGFAGVVCGKPVLLWQEDGGVYARSDMDAAELRRFLDLDRDYGALARELARDRGLPGMSAQAIGGAVGRNPISVLIPCHRVVGSNGNLTGYSGGVENKRFLLALEADGVQRLSVP